MGDQTGVGGPTMPSVPTPPDPSTTDIAGGTGGAYPPGGDPMTAGGTVPNGPGLAPPQPPPLPVARPQIAIPPNAAPTAGDTPPGAPLSLAPTNPGPAEILGCRLRLVARSASIRTWPKEISSGIGGAFTAAGNSRGKSPFQAFASGAGAGIEGSDKKNKQLTDEQSKYLTQAIAAAKAATSAL